MYAFPVRLLAAIREVPGWSAILYPVREFGVLQVAVPVSQKGAYRLNGF